MITVAYVLFQGCAKDILISQSYDRMISYVMRYCDLLLYHQIKPVLVFDGRNLPSKAGTEKKRRQNRAKYKQMAKGSVFLSITKYISDRLKRQNIISIDTLSYYNLFLTDYMLAGEMSKAVECAQRCIDITPEMAR